DAVVHLVAIIAGGPGDFERIMVQGTRDLLAAAKAAGTGRWLQMSALGTNERSKDVVPYYGAKWAMEQDVKASGLEWTIFRPSFVFGREGGVLPQFVRQVRWSPLVPVVGDGERKLQPIWADDVAACFARALGSADATGRTFELGGPDRVTWNELYLRIARTLGKRRRLVHVPVELARTGAALAERLPSPPVTRDMLTMLELEDNVTNDRSAAEVLGVETIGLDEQLRRAVE
ncbi:MAG: NAD-dependent epimerase/dehydratase family protein, partial [Actinobacteria bacterium]